MDVAAFFGAYCKGRRSPEFRACVQDSPAAHPGNFVPDHGRPGPR